MKKLLAAALIAAMLTSLLAGCGTTSTDSPDTSPADTTTENAATEEAATEDLGPYVEKKDYEGKSFSKYVINTATYSNYYFADEQTGEAMNDAVYERKCLTEEYLNVKFSRLTEQSLDQQVEYILSGDTTHHLFLMHLMGNVGKLAAEKMVVDWNTVSTVDLSRHYWNQGINESLGINGISYYAVSDYIIKDPVCLLMNKDMVKDLNLEEPYDLVREGKWTLDAMLSMAETATSNINGDGTMDVNDRYGFGVLGDFHLISFMYAADCKLVDENYQLILNNERTINLVEKLHTLLNTSGDTYTWAWGDRENTAKTIKMPTGRVLFQAEASSVLLQYRECEVDYGILPYPKFDETQKDYISNDWGGLMAIPATAKDLEMIGEVVEMLAYFSGETTVPAYYNMQLGSKLSRDPETVEMLEIIFDSVVYDPGCNYFGREGGMNQLFYMVPNLIFKSKSSDFASFYAKNATSAQQQIDTFLSTFNN